VADKSKNDSYKTAYYKRIRQCFTDTYHFIDRYKHSRAESDFKSICEDLGKFSDPFTVDLLIAVLKEIESEYKSATGLPVGFYGISATESEQMGFPSEWAGIP